MKYTTDKTLERARKKNEVSSKNEEAAQKTQERSSKKSELVQKSTEKIHKTVRKKLTLAELEEKKKASEQKLELNRKLTGAKELGEKRQALATKVGKESDRKKAASDEMTQKKIMASTAGASKQEANAGKEVEGSKVKTLKAKDADEFKELTSKLTAAEEKERERKAILK